MTVRNGDPSGKQWRSLKVKSFFAPTMRWGLPAFMDNKVINPCSILLLESWYGSFVPLMIMRLMMNEEGLEQARKPRSYAMMLIMLVMIREGVQKNYFFSSLL